MGQIHSASGGRGGVSDPLCIYVYEKEERGRDTVAVWSFSGGDHCISSVLDLSLGERASG